MNSGAHLTPSRGWDTGGAAAAGMCRVVVLARGADDAWVERTVVLRAADHARGAAPSRRFLDSDVTPKDLLDAKLCDAAAVPLYTTAQLRLASLTAER